MLIRRFDSNAAFDAAAHDPQLERFARVDGDGGLVVDDRQVGRDDGRSGHDGRSGGDARSAGGARSSGDARSGDDAIAARTVFTGGRFGANGGDWLFFVGLWTPADFRDEFVAWYQIEHMPILLECPLWDGCRFVETAAAEGAQFYSLHQLNDRAALDSEERKRSRATPWFGRLSRNDWFDGAFTRTLYRRAAVR